MAQIRIEPKRTSIWPFVLIALVVIVAAWFFMVRSDPMLSNAVGADSLSRDTVAGAVTPPPRDTIMAPPPR
mgnify:CR=1 FL=1